MDEKTFNHDFKASTQMGQLSLTKEQIIDKLEKNMPFILNKFKRYGIITCKDYDFITKMTFSDYDWNSCDGEKNDEEKQQAIKNREVVANYFNGRSGRDLKVGFAADGDLRCALYNPDRHNEDSIRTKFYEIFS